MYFPTLNARPRSQQSIDVFAGYNHNVRIQENEFYANTAAWTYLPELVI